MRKSICTQAASGIVLFYPGFLLAGQIHDWAEQHGGCRATISFERTLPGIRRWALRAALAIIDASSDPAQGTDAFLQSVSMLTSDAVAVYTEKMHDGLELLVRTFGAPLLLGPMSVNEWEEFLEPRFPTLIPLDASGLSAEPGRERILRNFGEHAGNKV
ncbi:MAG: hypothetical protein ABSG67_01070, partial [Thermoguttaceae bacterium]